MSPRYDGPRARLKCTAILAVALVTRGALAQGAPPPAAPTASTGGPASGSLATSLTGMAKADYVAGRVLYEDGDFHGALQKLTSSYDASKDPRLLWDMAACEKSLRHYANVLRLVDGFLSEGGALVTEKDRTEATDLIRTVTSFVTDLSIDVDQGDATIFYDDQAIGKSPLPGTIRVDMGTHKIRVTKAGFLDFTATPEFPGGQPFHLSATLVPERHEGQLRILTGPSDVIQVDQRTVGTGLWSGTLKSGPHSVYVSARGKLPHQTDVMVQDNDLTTLHVTLETEKPAVIIEKSGIPAWVWIAGGAVLVGGGVGAYFLLKPDNGTKYQAPTQGTWGTVDI